MHTSSFEAWSLASAVLFLAGAWYVPPLLWKAGKDGVVDPTTHLDPKKQLEKQQLEDKVLSLCDGLWVLGRLQRGLNAHREPIATLLALRLPPCLDSRLPNPNSPAGDHAAVCSVLSNVVWPRAEVLEGQDDVTVSIRWRTRIQLVCSDVCLKNEYKCGKKRSGKVVSRLSRPVRRLQRCTLHF